MPNSKPRGITEVSGLIFAGASIWQAHQSGFIPANLFSLLFDNSMAVLSVAIPAITFYGRKLWKKFKPAQRPDDLMVLSDTMLKLTDENTQLHLLLDKAGIAYVHRSDKNDNS